MPIKKPYMLLPILAIAMSPLSSPFVRKSRLKFEPMYSIPIFYLENEGQDVDNMNKNWQAKLHY